MPSSPPRSSPDLIGRLAETLVAQWLQQQAWQIVVQRWHCRWGELDIVAIDPTTQPCLVFVEVKARSRGNWDADGLLAIDAAKQRKLLQTAQLFLADSPQLETLPCRFDVAAVRVQVSVQAASRPSEVQNSVLPLPDQVELGQPVQLGQHRLTLYHYIPAAFEA